MAAVSPLENAILGLETLSLILLGLSIVVLTALAPCCVSWPLLPIHLWCLWESSRYLAFLRWFWLPLRRFLVPVVMTIARIESAREDSLTWYRHVEEHELKPSVRRRFRANALDPDVRHEAVRSETRLCLKETVPIVWEHQRRMGAGVDDFVKRFLVLALIPDAVLDLYWRSDRLVGLQLSIGQGEVWHWFLHFATETRSGIWFHGVDLAYRRATSYVNGQPHCDESKTLAGMHGTKDTALLQVLYPWSWGVRIEERHLQA